MEKDLNVSLQSIGRKGRGLYGQNDWRYMVNDTKILTAQYNNLAFLIVIIVQRMYV